MLTRVSTTACFLNWAQNYTFLLNPPNFCQIISKYSLSRTHGFPTLRYCALELFLSPNYCGDLILHMTDDTASNDIRRFVMQRVQQLLIGGANIAQTAEQLGFDYPQHFTRVFKKCYGVSPSAYLKQRSR